MINNLLKIFKNYTRSLEILYLLNDIKKIVRLDANDIELKNIKEFCIKNQLNLQISDFKLIKIQDKGKGGYANIVKTVPLSYPNGGLFHVYISKDNNRAKFLKLLEHNNDDKAIGELLGYPKCCINFFLKNKEIQQTKQNDYILPALNNSGGYKFPFYNNYAIRYFDITLLSHFPHNFNCEESIKIAIKNLKCINKFSKELASKFEIMLKNPVLYSENDGIYILKNYKLNDNILIFNKITSTINNNELLNLLNKNKKIEIIDKNKVKINNKTVDGIGLIIFS